MGQSKASHLWKKMFFRDGIVVRFTKTWTMTTDNRKKRYIMSVFEGELATVTKIDGVYYLRLHEERFSLSIARLAEVPLEYLEIVTDA